MGLSESLLRLYDIKTDMTTNDPYPLFDQNTAVPDLSVAPAPIPDAVAAQPSKKRMWFIAGSVVLTLVSLLFLWKLLTPRPAPIVEDLLSPTPTPTPIRILSPIATESAFLRIIQIQASLSAGLTQTNLDDPSLSPPTIALPLGFKL